VPLLARLRFDKLVTGAGYPGSMMVPAPNTLLALDKERCYHIDDFNFDEALGLLAGLNILSKKWLYFDSKVVEYSKLSKINQRGIHFVTIRHRGAGIGRRLDALGRSGWKGAVLDALSVAINGSGTWINPSN
jgi:hypothetical protein